MLLNSLPIACLDMDRFGKSIVVLFDVFSAQLILVSLANVDQLSVEQGLRLVRNATQGSFLMNKQGCVLRGHHNFVVLSARVESARFLKHRNVLTLGNFT